MELTDIRLVDKHERAVKVQHGDDRLHASVQHGIDQVIVVIDGLLINRSARQNERQNASPRDRETVVLNAHSGHTFDVLLVEEVVLIGDVVLGLRAGDELLQERRRAAVETNGAFNLSGTASNTEHEVIREIIAILRAKVVRRGQDQLAAWNGGRRDSCRVDTGGSLRQV